MATNKDEPELEEIDFSTIKTPYNDVQTFIETYSVSPEVDNKGNINLSQTTIKSEPSATKSKHLNELFESDFTKQYFS